jgi:hypothetical protein
MTKHKLGVNTKARLLAYFKANPVKLCRKEWEVLSAAMRFFIESMPIDVPGLDKTELREYCENLQVRLRDIIDYKMY